MYKQNIDLVLGNETGAYDFSLQEHAVSISLESQARTVPINSVCNENRFYGNFENACSSLHIIFQMITEIREDGLDTTRAELWSSRTKAFKLKLLFQLVGWGQHHVPSSGFVLKTVF